MEDSDAYVTAVAKGDNKNGCVVLFTACTKGIILL
jgi:hypothetical protein